MAEEPNKKEEKEKEQPQEEKEMLRDVVEEKVKEEAPEEAPEPEKTPEEPEEKEEPVDVPLEEVAKEVETQTRDKVKAEILEALGVTEEQKEEAEEAGYQTPWEKRGDKGPKSWDELLEASAELTDFRRELDEKRQQAQQEQQQKRQEEYFEKQNQMWDIQLEELREAGHLPKVDPSIKQKLNKGEQLTSSERRDEGLVAQYNLIKTMNDISIERQRQGKPPVTNLKEVYYEYYDKEGKQNQPAGADAPVSGGSTPVTQSEGYNYQDIHKSSLEDIMKGS